MAKTTYLALQHDLDKTVSRSNKFFVHRLLGQEGICTDFAYQIHVSSLERLTAAEISTIQGGHATLEISYLDKTGKTQSRAVNGIIHHVKELGMSRAPLVPDIWRYEINLGSWLTQLDQITDCRIFQANSNDSVKIVSELLTELGFRDFKNKVRGKLPRRDFVAMYNESVFNFIKRILFADGIFWYFVFSAKRHTLVLTDDIQTFPENAADRWGQQEGITDFSRESSHIPVRSVQVAAYDWENPPIKKSKKNTGFSKSGLDHFQFPSDFKDHPTGEKTATQFVKRLKNRKTIYQGGSNIRSLTAANKFKLVAPMFPEIDQKPVIVKSMTIEASSEDYSNRFEALQASDHFQPDLDNGFYKPCIYGSQTATVVGEGGNGKVQTDKKGRVKVRFHWDHHSPESSTKTSAYVRVSAPCAGPQRGFVFTPRVGEEVTISYEHGNPSMPLIMGSMYSNRHKPPKSGNSKPYRSTIKTSSESDANAMVFNDTPQKETFDINAKKDLNINVGRNLDVDVKENMIVEAKKINIVIRKDIKVQAGGNIINFALNSLQNTAGSNISNMALGGIINVAGGLLTNMAGCTETNTAIFSVKNTSGADIKSNADTLMANTALNGVGSSGPKVTNDAKLAMTNISKGGIINDGKDVETKSLFQLVKVKENEITETKDVKVKGLFSKIN